MAALKAADTCCLLQLHDDEWESIFKLLDNNSLRSLSLVSKPLLLITNRLRSAVTISQQTIPFLPNLFQRFPNLTSLNIHRIVQPINLNSLLTQISHFPLNLKSLTLNNPVTIPANGLLALSGNMNNLTSFTCHNVFKVKQNDIFVIGECFPKLEQLTLTDSFPYRLNFVYDDNLHLPLSRLYNIFVSQNFLGGKSIEYLCRNSPHLREVRLIEVEYHPRTRCRRLFHDLSVYTD